jgi:hypothetical protein
MTIAFPMIFAQVEKPVVLLEAQNAAVVSLTAANPIQASLINPGTRAAFPKGLGKEVHMPTSKELTIHMENKPGTLGKLCKALAEQRVNILAFQSVPSEKGSVVRMVVDNPTNAKKVLDSERLKHADTEIVQTKLANRPGELGRAASELGGSNINIEYAYSGLDSNNQPVVFFGVKDAGRAAMVLDKIAAAA